ncbi:MAG: carbon-nitrogen hydrolase family protein [Acholeplasmataceae bacterium]|nr:MAG: carbon-nitrogen hydrolase family protein [Acholeplasmataceae bacterium]
MSDIRRLNIALLQLKNRIHKEEGSFDEAEQMLQTLDGQNIDFAFLPELLPRGYAANEISWRYKERLTGPTVQWAKSMAIRYGMHIGFGLIEHTGKHVYNTYAIVDPEGTLLGFVRKQFAESYVFKPEKGPKFIDTSLGRIGIGICADSHQKKVFKQIAQANVDVVVLPHAWPVASVENKIISRQDIEDARALLTSYPLVYPRYLHIPALFINTVGDMQTMKGLLGKFITPDAFSFQGMSTICDQNRNFIGQLDHQEGILTGTIVIQRPTIKWEMPKTYQKGWLHQGSTIIRHVIMPLDGLLGRLNYALRKKK